MGGSSREKLMAELRIGCGKPRAVRAPRGTELHDEGWHQEAALQSMARHCKAVLDMKARGPVAFDYGKIFNDLVRAGKVKAPIVVGRDHFDAGSVASPNGETESMRDGSDAVAGYAEARRAAAERGVRIPMEPTGGRP